MVYAVVPKTLVIGARGFVGRHFFKWLRCHYPDTMGTHHSAAEGLKILDLENPELNFSTDGYTCALIAAGCTNLQTCEKDPQKSRVCNVEAPLYLADRFLQRGIAPIFFSSDFVFDGAQEIYDVTAMTSPLNHYGRQKAELEERAVQKGALIVRMSKVYGTEVGDKSLFDRMCAQLIEQKIYFASQEYHCAPLYIGDLIRETMHLAGRKQGIVNLGGPECVSYSNLATALAEELGLMPISVVKTEENVFRDGVKRPKRVFLRSDLTAISWREGMKRYVRNRKRDLDKNS